MTDRNSPCPCGSGKKHKKCCLPLAQAFKVNSIRKTGEQTLINMITMLSNNSLKNIKDNKFNQGKEYSQSDFQLLVNMAVGLWNLSFLPAARTKQIVKYINDDIYQPEVNRMIVKMRSHSICTKLMVVTATSGEIKDDRDYPIALQTHKIDIDYINDNIEEILLDINNAVIFMVENAMHKESNPKAVAELA